MEAVVLRKRVRQYMYDWNKRGYNRQFLFFSNPKAFAFFSLSQSYASKECQKAMSERNVGKECKKGMSERLR